MARKKLITKDPKYRYFIRANILDGSPQIYRVDKETNAVRRLSYDNDSFVRAAFTFDDLTCTQNKDEVKEI